MTEKKLLMVVNVDWFFISHRINIAKKAITKGWTVYVACNDTGRANEITSCGIHFINLDFSRSNTKVFSEIKTLINFYSLYKKIRPTVVHHITLKPVIYGSIISKILKINTVNAISGLGYNFTGNRKSVIQILMIKLMKFGFSRKNIQIIFQNTDDYNEFLELNINIKNHHFIKGSGVDLKKFNHTPFKKHKKINILFPSRMLWDKGVSELKKATEILKVKYHSKIIFILAGLADTENKAGVSEKYLKSWENSNYVNWIGYKKDMVSVYQNSDIVILPSYREGMPKALIEACAIGRPIVTTNAIGCKECVDEGINGYKVPVKSIQELANALEKLILSSKDRLRMGNESRLKAEREFSQESVINKHLQIYNNFS